MKKLRLELIGLYWLFALLVLLPLEIQSGRNYHKICGLSSKKSMKCQPRERYNCSHKVRYDMHSFVMINQSIIPAVPPDAPTDSSQTTEPPLPILPQRPPPPPTQLMPNVEPTEAPTTIETTAEPTTIKTVRPTTKRRTHPPGGITETIPYCDELEVTTPEQTTPEITTEAVTEAETTEPTTIEPTTEPEPTTPPEPTTEPPPPTTFDSGLMDIVCPFAVSCEDECCERDITCVFKDDTEKYTPRDEYAAGGKWLTSNGTLWEKRIAEKFATIRSSFLYEFAGTIANESREQFLTEADKMDASHRNYQNQLSSYFENEMTTFSDLVKKVIAEKVLDEKDIHNITNWESYWKEKFEEDYALEKVQLYESLLKIKINLYTKYRKTHIEEKMALKKYFVELYYTTQQVIEHFKLNWWVDSLSKYNETFTKMYKSWNPCKGAFLSKRKLYQILINPHIALLKKVRIPTKRIKKIITKPEFAKHVVDSTTLWFEPSIEMLTTFTYALQYKMEAMVKINSTKCRFAKRVYRLYCKHKKDNRAGLNYIADEMFSKASEQVNLTINRLVFLVDNHTDFANDSNQNAYTTFNIDLLQFTKKKILAMDRQAKTDMRSVQANIASGLAFRPTTIVPYQSRRTTTPRPAVPTTAEEETTIPVIIPTTEMLIVTTTTTTTTTTTPPPKPTNPPKPTKRRTTKPARTTKGLPKSTLRQRDCIQVNEDGQPDGGSPNATGAPGSAAKPTTAGAQIGPTAASSLVKNKVRCPDMKGNPAYLLPWVPGLRLKANVPKAKPNPSDVLEIHDLESNANQGIPKLLVVTAEPSGRKKVGKKKKKTKSKTNKEAASAKRDKRLVVSNAKKQRSLKIRKAASPKKRQTEDDMTPEKPPPKLSVLSLGSNENRHPIKLKPDKGPFPNSLYEIKKENGNALGVFMVTQKDGSIYDVQRPDDKAGSDRFTYKIKVMKKTVKNGDIKMSVNMVKQSNAGQATIQTWPINNGVHQMNRVIPKKESLEATQAKIAALVLCGLVVALIIIIIIAVVVIRNKQKNLQDEESPPYTPAKDQKAKEPSQEGSSWFRWSAMPSLPTFKMADSFTTGGVKPSDKIPSTAEKPGRSSPQLPSQKTADAAAQPWYKALFSNPKTLFNKIHKAPSSQVSPQDSITKEADEDEEEAAETVNKSFDVNSKGTLD